VCSSDLRKWGALLKPDAFRLLAGEEALRGYSFATKSGEYLFCETCGVQAFSRGHVPELGGEIVSVQVMCLDDVTPEELAEAPINYGNGRDNLWWEQPTPTEMRYL
jgi:hypothetical protein